MRIRGRAAGGRGVISGGAWRASFPSEMFPSETGWDNVRQSD